MTKRAATSPKNVVTTINQSTGIALSPPDNMMPASPDRIAPMPINIAPPRPEAVPARCGRTESMPDVALGIVNPFPMPTKVMKPKNVMAEPKPNPETSKEIIVADVEIIAPIRTILLMPKRVE